MDGILAAHLENGIGDPLEEVLCHELAHVAVYRLHGRAARTHGPEWLDAGPKLEVCGVS